MYSYLILPADFYYIKDCSILNPQEDVESRGDCPGSNLFTVVPHVRCARAEKMPRKHKSTKSHETSCGFCAFVF